MKVILLRDVPKIGFKLDTKEVADGYALNFLIPQKAARQATPEALAWLEKEKRRLEALEKARKELLSSNLDLLKDMTLELKIKTNEHGHLFAGIHAKEIAEAIQREKHLSVPVENINLPKPIKEAGEYRIDATAAQQTATFTLVIKGDSGERLQDNSSSRGAA